MSNGLKNRLERLSETLNPTPPVMLTVVLRRFAPIEDPEAIQPPQYCVGRYGVAMFLGGTPRQRWREVRRLRRSGEYDTPLVNSQPAIGEGEGEGTTEVLPAGSGQGNGRALGEGHG